MIKYYKIIIKSGEYLTLCNKISIEIYKTLANDLKYHILFPNLRIIVCENLTQEAILFRYNRF